MIVNNWEPAKTYNLFTQIFLIWTASSSLPIKDKDLICSDFLYFFFHFIFQELFKNFRIFIMGVYLIFSSFPVGVFHNF